MSNELLEWLDANKIQYEILDDEVVNVEGLGKMYYEDTNLISSIFRTDLQNNVKFNATENIETLHDEEIFYIVFKFGDNWYYYDTRKEFKFNVLKYIGTRKKCEHDQPFVNLGVHTPYELLNGSFSIGDWVKKTKYLGQKAIGICDYNTMAGALVLQKECLSAGISPVFGYSLTFTDGVDKVGAKIYCQTQNGLQNLLRIQKAINVDSTDKIIDLVELLNRGEGNIIVFDKYSSVWLHGIGDKINKFLDSFDDCYYQLDLSEFKAERIDIRVLESTKYYFDNLYDNGTVPPVLISDCYYLDKDDAKNKIILNKIAEGAAHEQSDDQYFKDLDEHWVTFEPLFDKDEWEDIEDIFNYACENTVVIADGAKALFETDRNFMPQYDMTDKEKERWGDRHSMFLGLLKEGFDKLVPEEKKEVYKKRLEHEIYVLEATNNVDYMLVQYDTVNWARENGILVGCGRGSAGGCLVLYLLGITLIDPIKYDLIFERFLLPERAGLYPSDVTVVGDSIESKDYIEVELNNGQTYKIDKDAQLVVKRDGEDNPIVLYADELQEGDDIQFDNRDVLFTLHEI
ncbi:PHP domain-containing protein [Segatella copri]|uniref:DNA polymerase III subunit alpha n=1 Tax=Segatella copri TaxID=165179 RepID=A0AAW5IAI5_9BACT|nr:PHP domain-containing protein [Segatella copri]MCP9547567.1 PHP domain-containing protein [Segatella copri]MCP9549468.1 PHP domain-containing protein [Segatella copri]MCP9554829.1 PHP domain-containing protein [Segatella copri]MCP9569849.1 PHP domain-containing protein [Segatella copri]